VIPFTTNRDIRDLRKQTLFAATTQMFMKDKFFGIIMN
jgi:hypothetical protein